MEIFYNFWKELETIYEYEVHENEKIPEISQDNRLIISSYFWKEIQSVYEDICEPSNEDFQQMEKSIIRIKERAFSLVRREFKQHPNNPLFLKFSLFEPMGRGQDEVHYTKTLAWFMDKNQNHGFDSEILKSLWSLFNYENNLEVSNRMTVESEKWCGENRLDIAIMEDNIIKIAIEAKINAEENHKTSLVGKGSSQLRKYDKWLKKNKQHQNCKKFF